MTIPNQLTVARIILTPVFAWFFLSKDLVLHQLSLIVFFVAAITDWYDGWIARKFNYMSNLGKFLDPLADKILTSTAFVVLALIGMFEIWMIVVIVIRDLIITVLRVIAEYKGLHISTSNLAKVKTFVQMIFLYYILSVYIGQSIEFLSFIPKNIFQILLNQHFVYYSMLVITIITFYTGIQYFYTNRYTIDDIFRKR